jgi:hypothetical protein
VSYCTAQWFGVDTMIGQLIMGALATKAKGAMAQTLISGMGTLIDNKIAAKKAKRKQANFYVNMRNAAQRAGFNPLTVLRSGTAGAYADAGYAPALTSNAFTNMLNDMRETNARISNMKAQERNMAHGQQMDKLNYELRKSEYQFNQGLASKELVQQLQSNKVVFNKDRALSTSEDGALLPNDPTIPSLNTVPKENLEQFIPYIGPLTISPAPMAPTSVVEEAWGDPVSWLYGGAKFVADSYYTGMKYAVDNGAQGFNHPMRGAMVTNRLLKQRARNSGARGVKRNYKVHKNDRFLGVMQ